MSNTSIRRLIGWLGTALVFLICAVVITFHFASGQNVQRIDVSAYTDVFVDENGGYQARLDVDRMIYEERLVNPPEADADQYPEIGVLRDLTVIVTPRGDQYELAVYRIGGEEPTSLLASRGIKLTNVKWTMSKAEIQRATQQGAAKPAEERVLEFPKYLRTNRAENGEFGVSLDVYQMLTDAGIDPSADPETDIGARALRSLDVSCTKTADGYQLQTTSTLPSVMEDLKAAGLKITNTQVTWTASEMEAHLGTVTPLPTPKTSTDKQGIGELDFSKYVRTNRGEDGVYGAEVDVNQMLIDTGVGVDADPDENLTARVLRSLGVNCEKTEEGYFLQTTSTLSTIMEDLKTTGLKITNTQWTWTEAEMEAHLGTVTPPETPTPASTPAPTIPAPTTPASTATAQTTPARNANAIDTLYHFDQTDVRKAIRAAKEKKYGSKLKSSEVKYNYFAVGGESSAHANVFRIVYAIKTSDGTEYLVADVYDLERETGYTASDVHLTVAKTEKSAKSTDDLKGYTVHTLTGGSMVFSENQGKSPFDKDGLVMAKSLSEKLTYDELWDIPQTKDKTLLQLLGYARNEMFARAGEKFKDTSSYRTFYSQYSWYKPTGTITVSMLKEKYPVSEENITTIKFLETLIKEG